jgi:hypothetical protein
MSTKFLFYIVKGFGLKKRGMRVKRKCNHFKCNQGFPTKLLAIKRKKLTSHQEIIKLAVMLVLSEIFHVFESRIACTETCQKYSVTVIFYYIFHIKPQFFKTLFQSQFLFDFDEVFTNRSENVRSFL